MGLTIYISSDRPVPKKFASYEKDGIKGSWLIPYRMCRDPEDGVFIIPVNSYLTKFPSWEAVSNYIEVNKYSECWTKEEHEAFHDALTFYNNNYPTSNVEMSW